MEETQTSQGLDVSSLHLRNRGQALIRSLQAPLVSIGGGLLIGALIMLATGYNPIEAYGAMVRGAFGGRNFANLIATLNRAVPIVGMGIAAAVAFRAGFFNIGGEGQLVLGGVTAALVTLYLPLPPLLLLPATFLAAAAVGGFYAWITVFFQFRFRVPLLISALLLNYPARHFASYLVNHPFRDVPSGMSQTFRIPEAVRLPELIAGSQLHAGLFVILAIALLTAFVVHRTVTGYELRLTGSNPKFTEYGGVDIPWLGSRVMFSSGSIAGLVGAVEVLGVHYRYVDNALVVPLYAWVGVMAALLARSRILGVVVAGFFFSAVQTGGFGMERGADVPRELSRVLQAVIIMLVAARTSSLLGRRDQEVTG